MQVFEINAEPRTDVGKGASRRLRRTGQVPGIVYGTKQDAVTIKLNQNELLNQLEQEAFYSHILTLKTGDKVERVVLKDLQRHPVKPSILHIDFQRIDEKEKLTMRVPLHFINEDKCVGVKQGGGEISHILNDIEINCLPRDLPEFIAIDMTDVAVGDTIHLGDIGLPAGVEIDSLLRGGDRDQPVASVHMPRVEEEEEPVEGAEELPEAAAAAAAAETETEPTEGEES